ncbi:MAG: hypothetical protein ACM3ST_13295 [Bdellovibrio bacteriovorus]
MKGPTFLEGALVALIAALAAALTQGVLTLMLPRTSALTLVIAGLGLGYLLYLLGRSRERAGRVVMVIGWLMVTGIAWGLSPGPWTQVLVQSGLIWLVRGLYHQATPVAALLDLGLIVTGLAAALWAGNHTGSLFLSVWCLFLIQAPFAAIPDRPGAGTSPEPGPDPFDLARRAAERAMERLQRRATL